MSQIEQAITLIKQRCPNASPLIGIVLGSGLGSLIDDIENTTTIAYADLPGFPRPTVKGHEGNLILGTINGVQVACLQGRSHTYENGTHEPVIQYVRTLKRLGCKYFLATNASGSLRQDFCPGDLVMLNDHINMQGSSPLVGPNDDEFGPRFPPLDNAYDKGMRALLMQTATDFNIQLHQGVYISVLGPTYETSAEIRAFRTMGAELVGMSTVPEVIVANHCGMKVAVIATITNYATGLASESHSHDAVVAMANQATVQLKKLVKAFIAQLK
tara:strand:+ start:853 stop:1668 length:816 start_codon:yes stop_codon:yes gene_type:complete